MKIAATGTLLFLLALAAHAELLTAGKPLESTSNKQTYVFKKTPQGELKVEVYLPEGWQPGQKHSAILMFFGGGFTNGSTAQFRTKAEYLASRGMVAMTPDYRVKSRQNTSPRESVEDAKSAIRWARINAKALGIDPDRIVASGGSAGGSCAALAGLADSIEPAGEDMSVSSRPNAMVLYNPALVVPGAESASVNKDILAMWKVSKSSPPMIFFFGTNDNLLAGSREVAKQAAAMGARAELYTAPGQKHGFFNDTSTQKNGSPGWHDVVLYRTDLFLTSLGYLSGKPTVKPNPSLVLTRDPL